MDNNIVFAQRGGQKVRRLVFNLGVDAFKAGDATILSEHLFTRQRRIVRMAYQQTPDSIVWHLRSDGILIGLTFEDEQTILGFHPHVLGGTDVEIESIAVIPTPDETEDQLWLAVKRTVNGQTVRWVEYLDVQYRPAVEADSPIEDRIAALKEAYFVDAGLKGDFTGNPQTTVFGLDHLIGETVRILW